jgi:hypothetical protein
MHRLFLLLLTFSVAVSACKNADKNVHLNKLKPDDYAVKIKIPTEWIEKVRGFNYSKNAQPLISQFEAFIKPDTLYIGYRVHDDDYRYLLTPMFVDLDSDHNEELICFLGWDTYNPLLCVFKKDGGDWYLIYMEQVHTFYSAPVLLVANNFSPNLTLEKISYFHTLNDTLFVNAFKGFVREISKTGTSQQKKVLSDYLLQIAKDRKAMTNREMK